MCGKRGEVTALIHASYPSALKRVERNIKISDVPMRRSPWPGLGVCKTASCPALVLVKKGRSCDLSDPTLDVTISSVIEAQSG